jgi:predicted phosphodiesterase
MDSEYTTRYKIGDIITHKTFKIIKRKIISITIDGNNDPNYTTLMEDSHIPPLIMAESTIDEHYFIEPKEDA